MTIDETTDADSASRLSAGLGAVLTYATTGRAGVHGMTIGADGSGEYAVLFMGNAVDAENAAREYFRRLERAGWRLMSAAIVTNEPTFCGETVRIVNAPLPGMEAPSAELTGRAAAGREGPR